MNPAAGGQLRLVHHANCRTWDIPDQDDDSSVPDPEEALVRYAASVAPVYRVLSALVAQTALLLLLSTDRRPDRYRPYHESNKSLQTEIKEAEATLGTISAPAAAGRHHWILLKTAAVLKEVLTTLDEPSFRSSRTDPAASVALISSLRNVHDMLQLSALPQAGISTVDLEQACCNCVQGRPSAKLTAGQEFR